VRSPGAFRDLERAFRNWRERRSGVPRFKRKQALGDNKARLAGSIRVTPRRMQLPRIGKGARRGADGQASGAPAGEESAVPFRRPSAARFTRAFAFQIARCDVRNAALRSIGARTRPSPLEIMGWPSSTALPGVPRQVTPVEIGAAAERAQAWSARIRSVKREATGHLWILHGCNR